MSDAALFQSFMLGGFECSSHYTRDGRRLDVIEATAHDLHVRADYERLQALGIHTVRDGIRWHLIERVPGQHDFTSALPQLRAARATGMQVIWDLCHYGWPDGLDIFSPAFVERYAAMVASFAALVARELDGVPFYAPINEISFFSWAGGEVAALNPYAVGRGFELKVQLARAAIAGMDAIWRVEPRARFVHVDPAINIVASPLRPYERDAAEGQRLAQFQAWDLLSGRLWPQIGGHERYLDIIGVNYYPANQWIFGGPPIDRFHPQYRWFRSMLHEVYDRYRRPLLVAETGCEDDLRGEWLGYIGREVRAALADGVPVEGLCLYPIVNHPGWENDRHCHNGLFDYPAEDGSRELFAPLARELAVQQQHFRPPQALASATAVYHDRALLLDTEPLEDARPHVCLYTDSANPSGMGEAMLALLAGLRTHYRVSFACPPTAAGARLLERAAALGAETLAAETHSPQAQAAVLRHWLRTRRVQIFHCHAGIGWEGLEATVAAHAAGVRAVVRSEHLPYLLTDHAQQHDHARMVGVVDRLLCVSQGVRVSMARASVPEHLLRVVMRSAPLRVGRLARADARAKFRIAPTDRVVLTVGRLVDQKGYPLLLDALPLVLAAAPDTQWLWAGDGPLAPMLRAQIAALGAQRQVRLMGRRDDVADLLVAADLFVLPSMFEGLPLAALEAMGAGLPVIATHVGGLDELVDDGVTGRLVAPGDVTALAQAISDALEHGGRAAQWGAAGRERASRLYGVERMVADTIAVYDELLGQSFAHSVGHNGASHGHSTAG